MHTVCLLQRYAKFGKLAVVNVEVEHIVFIEADVKNVYSCTDLDPLNPLVHKTVGLQIKIEVNTVQKSASGWNLIYLHCILSETVIRSGLLRSLVVAEDIFLFCRSSRRRIKHSN